MLENEEDFGDTSLADAATRESISCLWVPSSG